MAACCLLAVYTARSGAAAYSRTPPDLPAAACIDQPRPTNVCISRPASCSAPALPNHTKSLHSRHGHLKQSQVATAGDAECLLDRAECLKTVDFRPVVNRLSTGTSATYLRHRFAAHVPTTSHMRCERKGQLPNLHTSQQPILGRAADHKRNEASHPVRTG